MTTSVSRRQVLAYRAAAQGLHRDTDVVADLAVLDLGVQDTPSGASTHAIVNRLASPEDDEAASSDVAIADATDTTWTVRGAPHRHRPDELAALSRALWPWSDEDALARLDTSSSPVRASGLPARDALRLVAEQVADIVTEPMPKGEVSTALTPRIPAALTVACRQCDATHVVETLWRTSILPAGMRFDPSERTVTFVPIPGWPGVPDETGDTDGLIAGYLRLLGPATPADVASFLGTRSSEVSTRWPDGLAEVDVDGDRRWLPEAAVDRLESAPDPPHVRLLPPSDPWLQARDRELLVPDPEHRKAMWPILGRPGAILVDGEVAGAWRGRKKGRRLDLTLEPFGKLAAATRRAIDDEAELAARARGTSGVTVSIE